MERPASTAVALPCAVAQAESHKGEDCAARFEEGGELHGFAIYDGHGGPDCARYCAHEDTGFLPSLLRGRASLPEAEAIADVFWAADAECGAWLAARGGHGRDGGGAHAGSTATLLMVQRLAAGSSTGVGMAGGGFRCRFAWVGDSMALTVDMATGKMIDHTLIHCPDRADEVANLRLMSKAGKELPRGRKADRKKKAGAPDPAELDPATATTAEVAAAMMGELEEEEEEEELPITAAGVGAACKRAGVLPSAGCPPELMLRAFAREQLINTVIPKGRKYRRNACIFRRPRKKDENMPMVVATHEDPYSSHYRDLLMTRSICDWTKSAWVLPQPDVATFEVPNGKHVRALIASDGLWDICSWENACDILRAARTPQEAADALLEVAKGVYQGERGLEKMGDDTTVMVIDLLPGGPASAVKPKGGGCTLS